MTSVSLYILQMPLEKSLKCVSAFFLPHRNSQRVAPAAADRDFISPSRCAAHGMCLVRCEEKEDICAVHLNA